MAGNYPAGVTDMDEHFDLPNANEGTPELYGLCLDVYDGQVMNMAVYDGNSRLALSLEEIRDAHREYSERNPKGRYSVVPLTQSWKCSACGAELDATQVGSSLGDHSRIDDDGHGNAIEAQCGPCYPVPAPDSQKG